MAMRKFVGFPSENSQPPPNARWANAISNKFPDRVARGRFNSAPGSKTNTDFQKEKKQVLVFDQIKGRYMTQDAFEKTVEIRRQEREDIQGDVYEYLLNEIATAGKNGQFRTPRHIINLLVELVNPQENDKIIEKNIKLQMQRESLQTLVEKISIIWFSGIIIFLNCSFIDSMIIFSEILFRQAPFAPEQWR